MWSDYKTPNEGGRFFLRTGTVICAVACVISLIDNFAAEHSGYRLLFALSVLLLALCVCEFVFSFILKAKIFWVAEIILFSVILCAYGVLSSVYIYLASDGSARVVLFAALTLSGMFAGIIFHIVAFIRLLLSTDFV